nr:hypothetical protein [Tanacetum cinerariifolium]
MEEKTNRERRDVEFKVGDKVEMVTELPDEFKEWKPMEQPVRVCDSRMVLQNGKYRRQDKVVSEDRGNVVPLVGRLGRGKRTKKALKWQESFVMG